jgi:uncharacterized RDD family membrane protein YckC
VKCPKCSYLGFDTGDRCKNCGYDFSLTTDPSARNDVAIDLTLRSSDDDAPVSVQWDDTFDRAMTASPSPSDEADPVRAASESAASGSEQTAGRLPLFTKVFDDLGDEPLMKLLVTPRPPLAVRRTPRTPKLRPIPKGSRSFAAGPTLEFWDELPKAPVAGPVSEARAPATPGLSVPAQDAEVSGAARRIGAAAIDHLLLSAIDLSVIYFTLRMAGLPMAEWAVLLPVPLAAFLLLVKLSYFCAFTAVGGQTIGKMAARIRVVTTENAPVDGACALKRALAGAVSALPLGLGYLPALVGSDHLALHDYVTRTRVIALPSV